MDERELHELLSDAADGVVASADLPARAERRYRRRRNRVQVLVAAVVIVLIASSVAAASVLARGNDSRATVSPSVTTAAPTTPAPTTIPALATGTIDPSQINALSFVDNVGFGLLADNGAATSLVVRTDDGGRNWRRVGELIEPEGGLHFENATHGVAWGEGPLEVTTDGGAHWKPSDGGPVDNYLTWSGGRLWSLRPCVQSTPCGSLPLQISDDGGVTWQATAPLQQGLGAATVLATSRSNAYVVEPATDAQTDGTWQVAITGDAGASWTYQPVPCLTSTTAVSLAFNGRALVLVCSGQPLVKQELTSKDGGITWSEGSRNSFPGQLVSLSSVGRVFVANSGSSTLFSSSDDGQTWLSTLNTSGPARTDVVPGVGMWASVYNSGLWFSSNGIHWEQRSRSPRAAPPTPTTTPETTPGETRP